MQNGSGVLTHDRSSNAGAARGEADISTAMQLPSGCNPAAVQLSAIAILLQSSCQQEHGCATYDVPATMLDGQSCQAPVPSYCATDKHDPTRPEGPAMERQLAWLEPLPSALCQQATLIGLVKANHHPVIIVCTEPGSCRQ
jgi:hypothetical protein